MQITKYYSRGKIKKKKQKTKKHTTDPRRKQKNKYIKWKEIEFIILKFSLRKIQTQMASPMTFSKKLKNLHHFFPKNSRENIFQLTL